MSALLILVILSLRLGAIANECATVHNTYKVYYNWPFTLNCLNVIYVEGYEADIEHSGEFSCVVTEEAGGRMLMNASFAGSLYDYEFDDAFSHRIDTINKASATEYKVTLQSGSYCWVELVTLRPMDLLDESCDKNLERIPTHNVKVTLGAPFKAICEVPGDLDIPGQLVDDLESKNPEKVNIYWLYNCEKRLPTNTYMGSQDLHFANVSYETNPGVYTCVVEYKNMTRYRIHHRMCVERSISWKQSIKCVSKSVEIGDDVQIECDVDAGVGLERSVVFSARFNKLNETGDIDYTEEDISCIAYVDYPTPTKNKRFSCQLYMNATNDESCFYRPPTEEELKSHVTKLKMVYQIKNVQPSDFGEYLATITRAQDRVSVKFSLTRDREPTLARSHVILVICLCSVGCFFLLSLLLWILCEVELRWMWFNTFEKTVKESRRYSAYLAYYYGKEMSHTRPPLLEEFVTNLNKRLKKIGGEVFDRCREPGTEQYKAESIFSKLSECHRVVIVLTPEYVNDHWSVYEAYEAWKNVIEHGIKIIFITFPNTMSAVKNLPDQPRTALNKALQRHKVVHWDGTLPFTRRMRLELELLMPKLPQSNSLEMNEASDRRHIVFSKENGFDPASQRKDTNANICEDVENVV